jgi:hypothetical protein
VVLVTLAPTPIPEKNIRSNICWGLLPGIYGIVSTSERAIESRPTTTDLVTRDANANDK